MSLSVDGGGWFCVRLVVGLLWEGWLARMGHQPNLPDEGGEDGEAHEEPEGGLGEVRAARDWVRSLRRQSSL